MLLHHRFIQIAKRFGKKLFIIDRTTGRRVTYSRALIASLLLSRKFRKHEEGFTGIMLPTSAGCALSILGALMSGRTPVMINYSTGAADNARYAQRKCNFRTIITSKALLEKTGSPFVEGMVFIEEIMESLSLLSKISAAMISRLPASLISRTVHKGSDDDTLVILFTSGSEKEPKAVQLTHRNIISNIMGLTEIFHPYLSSSGIFLANLPYFHVFGQTANLWVPVYHGMTIITYANPLDYKAVCNIVKEEKPNLMVGTPAFYRGYLRKSRPGDFKSVCIAISGADKCPDTLRDGFMKKQGMILYEAYGTTETSPGISANTPRFNRPGSVGKVIPGAKVRIENYETGKECTIGETGKILVSGDLVMKGYLNDIEETSLHIRQGWYDTGDMGFIDRDGYLWHAGRLKRFVKIGGEMVSLVRVEDTLEKYLPEDVECCVVDLPDAVKGGRIVAAVTRQIDESGILKLMAEKLPNIALPRQFIIIEELPKMGSGKIDFRAVTAMVQKMQ